MRGWIFLALTIVCEICGTTCMKLSQSSTRWLIVALIPVFYGGTLTFMWFAFRHLEMGFVYAVWSGVGTAAAAVIGIFLFHESASLAKIACIVLIIVGVVGLNLVSKPIAPNAAASTEGARS